MNLFPVVKAQGIDELISPTIPFDDGGTTTPTPSGPTGPNISLSTNQFVIGVGQTIKVQVIIDTKGQEISEYGFQITFNSDLLTIQDADPNTPNTQIKFLDTFFVAQQNIASQQSGIITVSAKTDQGTATITERVVAEFELKAKAEGLSQVTIIKENSLLISANSTDILESTNELSITVSNEVITGSPTPTGSKTPSSFPTGLPDNGLIDDLGGTTTVVIGILLIASGVFIANFRRNVTKPRNSR